MRRAFRVGRLIVRLQHLKECHLLSSAVRFYNHKESMVRIAVRTITLNIFKVEDDAFLSYLCAEGAPPYFATLAWWTGNLVCQVLPSVTLQTNKCFLEY